MKGLDFETASSVDLKVHGLDRYVNSPDFRVLIASVAFDENKVERYDLVKGKWNRQQIDTLLKSLQANILCAHNAGFERACIRWLEDLIGMDHDEGDYIFKDSAVVARANGAASKLEAAAPQLAETDKIEAGAELIKLFCIPRQDGTFLVDEMDSWDQETWEKWALFGDYCDQDAIASKMICVSVPDLSFDEWANERLTQRMNDRGWPVDLDLVYAMQRQYFNNLGELEREFRRQLPAAADLNFRSPVQLKQFCHDRGVRTASLDEQHTERYIKQLTKKLATMPLTDPKRQPFVEVLYMLQTKQELGGSSLSKLQTIIDSVGQDGRLRNQYLHIGAGQSYRTSGRGVQLQNLKRLGPEIGDVTKVVDGLEYWDNQKLARNLRQVFRASRKGGQLIVADYSAVESRGLAYLAGEEWKLAAYRQGRDMYKVLAESMLGVQYDQVSKDQRQQGKVGELSCGYGAGPGAVVTFATKMGMDMTEDQAGQIVHDWRDANPMVVQLWEDLDAMLKRVVSDGDGAVQRRPLANDSLALTLEASLAPASLRKEHPGAVTVTMRLVQNNRTIMSRVFQGCYMRGTDVCYHKPSELKSGNLWRARWSKDGKSGPYKLYGGKIVGILTQSFCREIFFTGAWNIDDKLDDYSNTQVIGQFHDEVITEWWPQQGGLALLLPDAIQLIDTQMSRDIRFPSMPLAVEVKTAKRYIK